MTSAAVVAAVALLAPLTVRLTGLRVPEVVLQILLGIVVGPQVLGWAQADPAFLGLVVAIGLLIIGFERSSRVSRALVALQDTTAEVRVRGALALLMLFAALATAFGLEAILGAFLAGATLKLLDRDRAMTHTRFRLKLPANCGAAPSMVAAPSGWWLKVPLTSRAISVQYR